jgi:hypothetical protein
MFARAALVGASILGIVSFTLQAAAAQPPAPAPSSAQASPAAQPPADAAVQQTVLVPGGTTVSVALAEPISSATAKVDDQVAIVVKKEVDIAGWMVIAAGANGHATVTAAQGAGSNGSGGKLALSVDWVYSADGGKIALSQTSHAGENGDNKGAASTATLLSWALLGPVGFFAHNFVRGHDVTIGTDKSFTVFVDHDVHIAVRDHAATDKGFDR